ncbi:hypothetical protein V5O48_014083 [Marasmius crinis-equi]|uniref:Uncharacterized protein n=1 Tax=Marasmius crinis-equi TaxID=585013 RepID=A0ABR3EYA6_9AGAR
MFAKNASHSVGLGQGSITDSWIWTYGSLRDMDQGQRSAFLDEVKRVRWHRARADMWRWIEEKEVLEEEFRRYIAACDKMAEIWKEVSKEPPSDSKLNVALTAMNSPNMSGYSVYATQKSRYYRRMAKHARERFVQVGGGWPVDGQTLWEYMDARRPNVEISWDLEAEGSPEEIATLEREILQVFEKPSEEEKAEEAEEEKAEKS